MAQRTDNRDATWLKRYDAGDNIIANSGPNVETVRRQLPCLTLATLDHAETRTFIFYTYDLNDRVMKIETRTKDDDPNGIADIPAAAQTELSETYRYDILGNRIGRKQRYRRRLASRAENGVGDLMRTNG